MRSTALRPHEPGQLPSVGNQESALATASVCEQNYTGLGCPANRSLAPFRGGVPSPPALAR
jgi:hypothetical protein